MKLLGISLLLGFLIALGSQEKPVVVGRFSPPPTPCRYDSPSIKALRAEYNTVNREYFDDKLPPGIAVEFRYGDIGDLVAETTKDQTGKFVITLGERNNLTERQAYASLLHEMIHIETWDTTIEPCARKEFRSDKKAQACYHGDKFMRRLRVLELDGAFDDLL